MEYKLGKKAVSEIMFMLVLLTIGMLSLVFNIQPAKTEWTGTVYIRADGSIDPPDAPITTDDNVTYTLIGNISTSNDGIIVERNNVIIDGNGYVLEGAKSGKGMGLSDRNNVTIKNVQITAFYFGIYLYYSTSNNLLENKITASSYGIMVIESSNNTLYENHVTNNEWGIRLYWSSNNTLKDNDLTANEYNFAVYGGLLSHYIQKIDTSNTVNSKPIHYWINRHNVSTPSNAGYIALINCSGILLKNLNLTNNGQGLLLAYTFNSTISKNNVTNNWCGIYLYESLNNTIFENNIMENHNGIGLDFCSLNNMISRNNVANNCVGIYITNHSNSNNISQNNITANSGDGISISLSVYNCVNGNNITSNKNGIYLYESNNNVLTCNIVEKNEEGIFLWNSGGNNFTFNNLTENSHFSFAVNGEYLSCFYQNIDHSNLINSKPVYYLIDLENANITSTEYPEIGFLAIINGSTVNVKDISLENAGGIQLAYSKNSSLKNIKINNCDFGVFLVNSKDITAENVDVSNSSFFGLFLSSSIDNVLRGNTFSGNEYGIASICSNDNLIYHNNFLNNSQQVYSEQSINIWNDGYPSGGNYWSGYNGTDLHWGSGQNETGSDGIGDTAYVIGENNVDRYPLMAPFSAFDAGVWNETVYHVDIISNSSLSNFNIDTSRKTVSFNVTGEENQTGFCRITIPNVIVEDLWHGNYTVLLNGETWPYRNWTDTANTYIYLNYTHSEHQIVIIPEFPSSIALLEFLMLITIPLILVKKGQQTRKANERT